MAGPTFIDDAAVTGLLKRLYDDLSVDYFPVANVLLANLEKAGPGGLRNMRWGGSGVFFNAVSGRPTGAVSSSAGYLPPDHKRTELQGNIGIRRVYVRRQIDMLAIQGTNSKKAAYETIGNRVVSEAKAAYKSALQFYAHGTGTGVRGLVSSVTSTTVIVVNAPYGIASAGQGALHLAEGQYIAVRDTTGATLRGKAYISTITTSGDNSTITLASAIAAMAATDIVVAATASSDEYNDVPHGVAQITNRAGSYATLHGISSTDSLPTRMTTTDLESATEIGEMDLWELFARQAGRSGIDPTEQGSEFLGITTKGIQKKLAQSFFGQRNWMMQGKVTLKGGFSAIEVCGVPLVGDAHCPSGTVYSLHKPSLAWVDSKDFGAVQFNDSSLWRFIADRDAYETSWSQFMNFAAPQRNAHGSIIGIPDTARYTHL